jgi:hypothetical protein
MPTIKEQPTSLLYRVFAWTAIILGMAAIIYFGAGNTWPF